MNIKFMDPLILFHRILRRDLLNKCLLVMTQELRHLGGLMNGLIIILINIVNLLVMHKKAELHILLLLLLHPPHYRCQNKISKDRHSIPGTQEIPGARVLFLKFLLLKLLKATPLRACLPKLLFLLVILHKPTITHLLKIMFLHKM